MTESTLAGFNWADYAIIGMVLISLLVGFARGFVKEAISLITWIIAIYIAMQFYLPLAELLAKWIQTPAVRSVIAFTTLLLVTIILGAMLNFLLHGIIHGVGLGGIDRLIGGVFGFARGILVIGLLVMFLRDTQVASEPWWQHSSLVPRFMPLADTFMKFIPKQIQNTTTKPSLDNKLKTK